MSDHIAIIADCSKHPGVHHLLPSHCDAYAEGERTATERIVAELRDAASAMNDRTDDYCHEAQVLKLWAEHRERGTHNETETGQ